MASKYAPNYDGPNAEKYDNAWSNIEGVVTQFKETLDDGFQLKDLGEWHSLVAQSYDVAKTIYGKEFGKDELTDLVTYIYWAINPNLPWIPEVIEKPLERTFIQNLAIPWAVGSAWDAVDGYIKAKEGEGGGE